MRFGVVTFPGSCDDADARLACSLAGEAVQLWHGDHDLKGVDAVVIPGGFSYGDHLRVGAVARFSPVMTEIESFARGGGPVLGICNGFQVLCEAGLLPGRAAAQHEPALRHAPVRADGRGHRLRVDARLTAGATGCRSPPSTRPAATTRDGAVRVVLRYADDPIPNGSQDAIAGVANDAGNVMGLMPHPEHAVDALTGSADGLQLFRSAAMVPA